MYQIAVKPLHERAAIVAGLRDASAQKHPLHELYENKVAELPVVILPIDLPVYRMANGRTSRAQAAYLREKGLPDDFFSAGEDNVESQQAQHSILRALAEKKSDSIESIITVLSRETQREPILITPNGVVINGNRRLAAMREIRYRTKSGKQAPFAHVECAVLPPISVPEIGDLEMRLQMAPNTKLPYHWIDECIVVDRQLSLKRTEKQVADSLRKKPADVKKLRGQLAAVRAYLGEWRGEPDNYDLVDNAEQFFKDLYEQTKSKKGMDLEGSWSIAWLILDDREQSGVKGRLYDHKKMMGPLAPKVAQVLANRFELQEKVKPSKSGSIAEGNVDEEPSSTGGMEFTLPSPKDVSPFQMLIEATKDPALRTEMSAAVIEIGLNLDNAERDTQKGQAALKLIESLHSRIAEVDLTAADPKTLPKIVAQLEGIAKRATLLREAAEKKQK
jgi:hypothetical protein